MAKQKPYTILGKVTYYRGDQASTSSSGVAGAKIWIIDETEGTKASDVNQGINLKGPFYTDDTGNYSINLANITSAYAIGDSVAVFMQYGRISQVSRTVVNQSGRNIVNFSLKRLSGLKDGLDNDIDPKKRFGLRQLGDRGCRAGMNDGMV